MEMVNTVGGAGQSQLFIEMGDMLWKCLVEAVSAYQLRNWKWRIGWDLTWMPVHEDRLRYEPDKRGLEEIKAAKIKMQSKRGQRVLGRSIQLRNKSGCREVQGY